MVVQAAAGAGKAVAKPVAKAGKGVARGGKAVVKGAAKGAKKGTQAAATGAREGTKRGARAGAKAGARGAGAGARAGARGTSGAGPGPRGRARGAGRPPGRLPGLRSPRLGGGRGSSPAGRAQAADAAGKSDDAVASAAGASLRGAGRAASAAGRLVRARLSPRRLLRLRRKARRRRRRRSKGKKVSISLPVLLCGLMIIPMSLGLFGGTDSSPGWSSQGQTAGDVAGIPYADLFNKTKAQGIDPRLLAAVAWVETEGFTPGIIDCSQASATGRLGILQVPPGIAEDLNADPCDPADGIPLGADLLVKLFEQYGSWPAAITAYHMLPDKDGKVPAEDPTAPGGYLEKVKATWDRYKAASELEAGVVSGIPYADIFNSTAALGIDPRLVAAVAFHESAGFDPDVIACRRDSPAGAKGIMQFMPDTAAGRGIDPCKPEEAIPAGAKYLVELHDKFGSWELALAGYNAGPAAVEQYGGIPPFEETQKYVPIVMTKWEEYKKQFPTGTVEGSDGQWSLPGPRAMVDRNPDALNNPHHDYPALDWGIPTGTPVFAVRSGTVTAVSSNPYNCYQQASCVKCGLGLTIRDGDGVYWIYCHGSQRLVDKDAKVKAGDQILVSGNTGNSSGPHLHLGIRVGDRNMCPQSLLIAIYRKTAVPDPRSLPSSGCIS